MPLPIDTITAGTTPITITTMSTGPVATAIAAMMAVTITTIITAAEGITITTATTTGTIFPTVAERPTPGQTGPIIPVTIITVPETMEPGTVPAAITILATGPATPIPVQPAIVKAVPPLLVAITPLAAHANR